MPFFDFIIRILSAAAFGFLIGFERQKTGHPAGIQTNALVCVGACCFQITAYTLGANDISRIAAQVVTGVGFLGSGIIFRDGINVRGINTAATIWCGAAIGVIVASGQIIYGAVITCAILLINIIFQQKTGLADTLFKSDAATTYYTIFIECRADSVMDIRALLIGAINGSKLTLTEMRSTDNDNNRAEITAGVYHKGRRKDTHIETLASAVTAEASVFSVKWELV